MMCKTLCQCGVAAPQGDGVTHEYIPATAGCWALFKEVLARDYSDQALYQAVHQLTVDAYAAQHPHGHPAKSLTAHLVGLYAAFEQGRKPDEARAALKTYVENRQGDFPVLTPPDHLGRLTIADVVAAKGTADQITIVRRWAGDVWAAWAPQHLAVAALVPGRT